MYREHFAPVVKTEAVIPLYKFNDVIHKRKADEPAPRIESIVFNVRWFYPDDENVITIYSLTSSAN